MQDRNAHIDIVFRNGLKGLEVLPPPSAWDEISQAAALSSNRRVYLSVAASVAVLVGLASAFWLVTQSVISSWSDPAALTLNQEIMPVGSYNVPASFTEPTYLAAADNDISQTDADAGTRIPSAGMELPYYIPVMEFVQEGEYDVALEGDQPPHQNSMEEIMAGIFPLAGHSRIILDTHSRIEDLSSISEPETDRWMIGGGFVPAFQIRPSSDDPVIRSMIESEKAFVSYSGGISVAFSFSNRLSVSTGIYYSSMGQMIDNISTYSGFAPYVAVKGKTDITVSTTAGNIVSTHSDLYIYDKAANRVNTKYGKDVFDPVKEGLPYSGNNLIQQFGYLELPFILRYKVVDRVLDLNLLGGVSYSLLVGNSVYAVSSVGEKIYTGYTDDISPFNISSTMGVGMSYNLSNAVSFNVEPMLRYNISAIGLETSAISKPWTFGVFSGLYFRF
ncbi:MAG: outer membrane beta-barrel protein [Bacteroidales bacterium]